MHKKTTGPLSETGGERTQREKLLRGQTRHSAEFGAGGCRFGLRLAPVARFAAIPGRPIAFNRVGRRNGRLEIVRPGWLEVVISNDGGCEEDDEVGFGPILRV